MKTTKHPQDPKNDFSERIKAFNKITDPVKKAEEGYRLANEMYAARQERLKHRFGILYHIYYFPRRLRNHIRRMIQ